MDCAAHAQPAYEITPIPVFEDNYIWMIDDGRRAAVVDPGDAMPVIERLETRGLVLETVLSTHHHHDHVGGNEMLAARYRPIVYGSVQETIPACTHPLRGGEQLYLLQDHVRCAVIAVPGHTLGHLAFVLECERDRREEAVVLFSGDTLFAGGCGRIVEGAAAMMYRSLQKLAALPPTTRIYCGHEYTLANLGFARVVEPANFALAEREKRVAQALESGLPSVPSLLYEELQTNPFLRTHEPAVRQAAQAHSGALCETEEEVFAALRQWKSDFRK